ncbi:MAG: AAA family ATPase [Coleofasciculus sp. S288]|nr:AAA family ATPase [Coleofasciculus sp. S288]
MKIKKLIMEALSLPTTAIAYHVSRELAALYPNKALVEGSECSFNVETYAYAGKCTIEQQVSIHNQIATSWDGTHHHIHKGAANACFEVAWQGHSLDVLLMNWREGWRDIECYWILADTQEIAESFFAAVCEWNAEIRDEVLVFEEGHWSKSPDLFRAIKSATFENLILRGTLKQDIQDDLENFFTSRPAYEAYGVPWKRGILFIGSPGNGKTHALKALINKLQKPCLYVKSFKSRYETDNDNIRKAFKRARQSAPCVLVLEDLDSLVNAENRSFFLNELDGFAANVGVVTVATTNHPDRLDPAILNRPSRFDRKYHFELPDMIERVAYIKMWNETLKDGMRLSDSAIAHIAELTDGFSFAYLKELFLSSMVRWMGEMEPGALEKMMAEQIAGLREQMVSDLTDSAKPDSEESTK